MNKILNDNTGFSLRNLQHDWSAPVFRAAICGKKISTYNSRCKLRSEKQAPTNRAANCVAKNKHRQFVLQIAWRKTSTDKSCCKSRSEKQIKNKFTEIFISKNYGGK